MVSVSSTVSWSTAATRVDRSVDASDVREKIGNLDRVVDVGWGVRALPSLISGLSAANGPAP